MSKYLHGLLIGQRFLIHQKNSIVKRQCCLMCCLFGSFLSTKNNYSQKTIVIFLGHQGLAPQLRKRVGLIKLLTAC